MSLLPITGTVRNRFIQAAVLLHALDPVRGEPTAHGLDQDPDEIETPRERLLKRKFLDSFALVCSTRKDADTVSAACMEEGSPEGTVIRIASNAGVPETTLSQLRELANMLSEIPGQAQDPAAREYEILLQIIQLDRDKIGGYFKVLRTFRDVFEEPISTIESRLLKRLPQVDLSDLHRFLEWFRHISTINDLHHDSEPQDFVEHIRWAQNAKQYYANFLKTAFSPGANSLPKWIRTIFKIGRYGIASRAFILFATELPSLVNPLIVKAIKAPLKYHFSVPEEEKTLTCVLKRVIGPKSDEIVPQLGRVWNTEDAENHFREACSLELATHAEMQLVSFYDHNRESLPRFRFIGVSKKSCYLCYRFLTAHPDSFCVSSCHQKLYPTWIPAPATDSKVYQRCIVAIKQLCIAMEATSKIELEKRLGATRRPVPADSSAGVSLSGLTDSIFIGLPSQARAIGIEVQSQPHPANEISSAMKRLNINSTVLSRDSVPKSVPEIGLSLPAIVFHFVRSHDDSMQDIVLLNDVLDGSTKKPSWVKLIDLLKDDNKSGIAFQEGNEYLLFNNQIRVTSERQFLAVVQYLYNAKIFNAEVTVCPTRI